MHAAQLSQVLSADVDPEDTWTEDATPTTEAQTMLTRPDPRGVEASHIPPGRNLWTSNDTNDTNERILYGARIAFDSNIECINPAITSEFRLHHMAGRRTGGTDAYCYRLRAMVLTPTRYRQHITDVWWYDIFFRIVLSNSFDDKGSAGVDMSLYVPPPRSGSQYDRYVVAFGLERGIAWFTTMGSPSFIFLETESATAPTESKQGKNHKVAKEKRIKNWSVLTSHGSELGHVDLRAGVACAFSDRLMDGDENTYLDTFWFK